DRQLRAVIALLRRALRARRRGGADGAPPADDRPARQNRIGCPRGYLWGANCGKRKIPVPAAGRLRRDRRGLQRFVAAIDVRLFAPALLAASGGRQHCPREAPARLVTRSAANSRRRVNRTNVIARLAALGQLNETSTSS